MKILRSIGVVGFLLLFSFSLSAQKKYQSLLWEVSGNGLTKPSYLYGTMHVSEKLVFQLGDPFYDAIQNVDIVALELEPEKWLAAMFDENGFGQMSNMRMEDDEEGWEIAPPLQNAFKHPNDLQEKVKNILAFEPPLLNYMLFRFEEYGSSADFEENTWLDMYIYQTGKKLGKKTIGLETYDQSTLYGQLARKAELNSKTKKSFDEKDRKKLIELQSQIEPAYRRQDLDLIDSISQNTNSKSFNDYILIERNKVFVNTIDSVSKKGETIFAGMGCAHLPGKDGVIEMLRSMGYTVKALDKGTRDAKRRAKLDKLTFKRTYSSFATNDQVVSFNAPTKVYPIGSGTSGAGWLAMDIPNGANFVFYRIKTYGGSLKQDVNYISSSIDSILYESIPGDIKSIKRGSYKGYPSVDIVNVNRRGDSQRRKIICTPEEIFIFKLSAGGDKVSKGFGNEFFESINVNYDLKIGDNKRWISPDKSVQANIPGVISYYVSESEFSASSQLEVTSSHQASGNYYSIYRIPESESFYIDESDYLNEYIAYHFVEDGELDVIEEKNASLDKHPSRFGKYRAKNNDIIWAHFMKHNLSNYAFIVNVKDSVAANNFFESIKLDLPEYSNFYTYNDTLLHFQMEIPYDLNKFQKNSNYGFNWQSDDEVNEAEGVRERIRIQPPFSPESILVKMNRHGKYYQEKDSTTFFKNIEERLDKEGELILKQKSLKKTPKGLRMEYLATDTASTRAIMYLVELHNSTVYTLSTSIDTLDGPSPFITKAFNSFIPKDTVFTRSIFDDAGAQFIADLYSTDSTTQKNAVQLVDEVWIHERNAEKLRQLLKKLPSLEDKKEVEEIKSSMVMELWRDTSKTNLDFLQQEYYINADSATMQNRILQNLGWMNTKDATLLMKKLMLDEPPIGGKSVTSNPLYTLKDSLELAKLLFPEAMSLVSLQEYEDPTYSILALLVDSSAVSNTLVQPYLNQVLLEAKNELKRVNGTEEKSYNFNTTPLINYCRILQPSRSKPEVKAFFDKIYKSKKRQLLIDMMEFNVNHKISTPDSIIEFIGKEKEYRLPLYATLYDLKSTNLLKSDWANTDSLVVLYAEKRYEGKYDNKGKVEKVELLGEHIKTIKGKEYKAIYLKFKRKGELDWRGTVFVIPNDGSLWSPDVWEPSNTTVLDPGENEQKELDRVYRQIVDAHRNNKSGDANIFSSYQGWE